jgi:hypothetical protein
VNEIEKKHQEVRKKTGIRTEVLTLDIENSKQETTHSTGFFGDVW